jgi:hypothetical protein
MMQVKSTCMCVLPPLCLGEYPRVDKSASLYSLTEVLLAYLCLKGFVVLILISILNIVVRYINNNTNELQY